MMRTPFICPINGVRLSFTILKWIMNVMTALCKNQAALKTGLEQR